MIEPHNSSKNHALYLLGFSPNLKHQASLNADCTPADTLDCGFAQLLEQIGVEHIESGDVWAWFKRIDRCEFEGTQGEKNLADLQWLTPRVIAHETVVAKLSEQSPFYPSRFGTLFSSEEMLRALTHQTADVLAAYFRRIQSKCEWGLKFYGDMLHAADVLALRDGILQDGKPAGGANYLKMRQLQRQRGQEKRNYLDDKYHSALRSLQSHFSEIVARPSHGPDKDTAHEELLSNLAILATQCESKQLNSWVVQWNATQTSETGIRVELTGPWPAYSFCPSLIVQESRVAA